MMRFSGPKQNVGTFPCPCKSIINGLLYVSPDFHIAVSDGISVEQQLYQDRERSAKFSLSMEKIPYPSSIVAAIVAPPR